MRGFAKYYQETTCLSAVAFKGIYDTPSDVYDAPGGAVLFASDELFSEEGVPKDNCNAFTIVTTTLLVGYLVGGGILNT